MNVDVSDPPFPTVLLLVPVSEMIYLAVVLLFARYSGAGLRELGLRRASVQVLIVVSLLALPLIVLPSSILILEEMAFGPDPTAEFLVEVERPRNPLQLIAMIVIFLTMVGPIEELVFRGFIQRGFENSFNRGVGLLIASTLFGLSHGLSTPYAIVPSFAVSLCLGYVWQRTGGNTTVSATLHGVYDSIAIIALYFLT
jgi:membrane protease YdiL (CAAX protease family)